MLVFTITETFAPLGVYIWLQFSVGIPSFLTRATRQPIGWLADFVTRSPLSGGTSMLVLIRIAWVWCARNSRLLIWLPQCTTSYRPDNPNNYPTLHGRH